jgi:hypothetical protein
MGSSVRRLNHYAIRFHISCSFEVSSQIASAFRNSLSTSPRLAHTPPSTSNATNAMAAQRGVCRIWKRRPTHHDKLQVTVCPSGGSFMDRSAVDAAITPSPPPARDGARARRVPWRRAGVRRSFLRPKVKPPLSSVLSPLLRRGERKKKPQILAARARSFIIVITPGAPEEADDQVRESAVSGRKTLRLHEASSSA